MPEVAQVAAVATYLRREAASLDGEPLHRVSLAGHLRLAWRHFLSEDPMTELRSEFPRPIATHDLPLGGRSFDIEATPDERAGLARRFEILAVNNLRADGVIRPEAGGRRVKLEGHLSAEVVQTCVVTLEPVTAVI